MMQDDWRNRTPNENIAVAQVLGQHLGIELTGDPLMRQPLMVVHFLTSRPRCPLCLEEIKKQMEAM